MDRAQGTLTDLLDRHHHANTTLTLAEIRKILLHVFTGLKKLHALELIHRDLSTNNILWDHDNFRINDMGMVIRECAIPYRRLKDPFFVCQIQRVRAPEICMCDSIYTTASDVWSAGCIAVELIGNGIPFFPTHYRDSNAPLSHEEESFLQLNAIFTTLGTPTAEEWPEMISFPYYPRNLQSFAKPFPPRQFALDPHLNDLISKMFIYNPAHRITASEALEHSFFTNSM
jgi:serine/threonine protein kinase